LTGHLNSTNPEITWGQVGQESHLHPAVLEHAARCPEASNRV